MDTTLGRHIATDKEIRRLISVLTICLEQYLKMNIKKILIHARLRDGSYVW